MRLRAAWWPLLLATACALAACDDEVEKRTQIVVVVDSDLSVPDALDEVRVRARSTREGATPTEPAVGSLADGELELPVSVTFEPGGDGSATIEVTASGHRDGALVVSQVRELSFARGKSVVLHVQLSRRCAGPSAPSCDGEQTCVAGSCEDRFVDVDELPAYTGPDSIGAGSGTDDGGGEAPGDAGADAAPTDGGASSDGGATVPQDGGGASDGGPADGGGMVEDAGIGAPCEPTAEVCNGLNDDCDTAIDEDFDFGSLAHCGTCGNACPESPPFAISVCASGTCQLLCAPGTASCDDNLANGCEARLSAVDTCGDCDTQCDGSTPFCAQNGNASMCVGSCSGDTPDECGDSCVDTQSDIFHCSTCDNECDEAANGSPVCNAGSCGFECPGAFQDCDGIEGNGCETDTLSDVDSCGGCEATNTCPTRAHATRSCVDGECGFVCAPSWGNCNGSASDGCETDTYDNDDHCGACNVRCTGSQVCCGTRCGVVNLLGICL